MKKLLFIALISGVALFSWSVLAKEDKVAEPFQKSHQFKEKQPSELQFGDLVFQSSKSGQSYAIQLATNSKYSHVGMIYKKEGGEWMVLEAVQPVKLTPLSKWITHGDGNEYVVRRLKNASETITDEVEVQMKKDAEGYLGKNYDIYFDWSDKEIYCSELVWKLYHLSLNLELGKLRPLSDFDLTHPIVKEIMKKRYGSDIPLGSMMISPGDMFDSKLLETVNH